MPTLSFARHSMISLGAATGFALLAGSPAFAQAEVTTAQGEIDTLPADLQSAPAPTQTAPAQTGDNLLGETTETIIGEDGVETVIRTRYITPRTATRTIPANDGYYDQSVPAGYYPAAQPVVFEREQWLEECRRRTSGKDGKEKSGIIGSLLGAIAGGIVGNRVSDGERLAGTLIGAGTGGLAGLAIGTLIGDGDDNEGYDCEASLENYLNQNGGLVAAPRLASRTIPAPVYSYPAYAPAPGYYGYQGCNCYQAQPIQQSVLVPVRYETRQRVIVRERVTEEMVPVTRERIIPPPPRLIKEPTKVVPAPRPVKMIKNQ